jgi:hypothetical protein
MFGRVSPGIVLGDRDRWSQNDCSVANFHDELDFPVKLEISARFRWHGQPACGIHDHRLAQRFHASILSHSENWRIGELETWRWEASSDDLRSSG